MVIQETTLVSDVVNISPTKTNAIRRRILLQGQFPTATIVPQKSLFRQSFQRKLFTKPLVCARI